MYRIFVTFLIFYSLTVIVCRHSGLSSVGIKAERPWHHINEKYCLQLKHTHFKRKESITLIINHEQLS